MNNKVDIGIYRFSLGDEVEISKLITQVYSEFVAPDCSESGNNFFYQFIQPQEILNRFNDKIDLIFIAKHNNIIVGVLSIKQPNHISLLFVRKEYQGIGIAKKLFIEFLKINLCKEITVNASPFSETIYKKLGFYKVSEQMETYGIKYIPMKMKIN